MRYALLQTTALVAAALLGGEACAAEQAVQLSIGGRYEGVFGGTIHELPAPETSIGHVRDAKQL